MSKEMHILFPFYANDREDAEQRAREILREQPYERIDLKAYPFGFVMHRSRISGTLGFSDKSGFAIEKG
jgi:hypothetical protein